MMQLNKETFLRVLKGAPLSLLLALWVHGAMGRKEIVGRTGWQKDTVDNALAFLSDLNLVVRPYYRKWALADGFHQLPLPSLAEGRNNRLSGNGEAAEGRKNRLSGNGVAAEGRKNRLSLSSSSFKGEEEKRRRAERPSDEEAYGLLRVAGVGQSMARWLASRGYVTAAYVQGHLAYAQRQGEPLRFALQRMKDGDGVPEAAAVVDAYADYEGVIVR